jgi:hypothetical protein
MKPPKTISHQVIIIVLLLLYCPFVIAEKIYKWTDENGKVHFGDKPPLSEQAKEVEPSFVSTVKKKEVDVEDSAKLKLGNERRMITLPDGTKYPAPHTEAERKAFKRVLERSIKQRIERVGREPKFYSPSHRKKKAKIVHNKSQLGAVPLQTSFGITYAQQVKVLDGKLKKRTGEKDIDAIERPVSSSMVFHECNPVSLKPGTKRSTLCDIWDEHLAYLNSRLKKECSLAGEKIYKTVSNVDGFLLSGLQKNTDRSTQSNHNRVIHELPVRSFNEYIVPSKARLYRQIEYYDARKKTYVTKKITGIRKALLHPVGAIFLRLIPKQSIQMNLSQNMK